MIYFLDKGFRYFGRKTINCCSECCGSTAATAASSAAAVAEEDNEVERQNQAMAPANLNEEEHRKKVINILLWEK